MILSGMTFMHFFMKIRQLLEKLFMGTDT